MQLHTPPVQPLQFIVNTDLKFPKSTEAKIPDFTGWKIPKLGLAC